MADKWFFFEITDTSDLGLILGLFIVRAAATLLSIWIALLKGIEKGAVLTVV